MELDSIQRNDIENLEQRVESTIVELRIAKDDNTGLSLALSKAEAALADIDSKYVTFKDKYYSKKTEFNVLKDKQDRLIQEMNRLKNENSRLHELMDSRKIQSSASDNKCKAYRDIRSIIEDFKQETIKKY